MPEQTQEAVNWALNQTWTNDFGETYSITKDDPPRCTDKVREYFNTNNIQYDTFSYDDLIPYLP